MKTSLQSPHRTVGSVAALPYPPRDPSAYGPAFWLWSGYASGAPSEFTIVAGDCTAALDHGGGKGSMTGHNSAWATAGGPGAGANGNPARAYLDVNPQGRGSTMKGTDLFGTVTNYLGAWTMVLSVCFQGDASTGSTLYDAMMILGAQGLSGTPSFVLGTNTTGTHGSIQVSAVAVTPTWGGAGALQPFGTQPLQNGTAGTSTPSYQVLAVRHYLNTDNNWYLDAYVDGIRYLTVIANNGTGITIGTDSFSLSSVQDGNYLGPRYFLFDAAWYKKALTSAQIRSLSLWLLNDVNAPQTVPNVVGCGASITLGFVASPLSLGWFNTLAAGFLDAYGQTIITANVAVDSSTAEQWQSTQLYLDSAPDHYAVRAVNNVATMADWASNSLSLTGSPVAQIMRCYSNLASRLYQAGFSKLYLCTMMPFNVSMGPTFATNSDATEAAMLAYSWPSYVKIIDWRDHTDPTPNPASAPLASTVGGTLALFTAARIPVDAHPDNLGHQLCMQAITGKIGRL